MATEERLYTVDDVWQQACAPENETYKICLIDGELLITMSPRTVTRTARATHRSFHRGLCGQE